jgi:hypothetical protein
MLNCVKINLTERSPCVKSKNLVQISIVPIQQGGTNEVKHEDQKKFYGELYRCYQKAKKKARKILDEYALLLEYTRIIWPLTGGKRGMTLPLSGKSSPNRS